MSSKTLEDWVNTFSLANSAETIGPDTIRDGLDLLQEANAHRTPARAPRRSPSLFDSDIESLVVGEVPEVIRHATSYPWSTEMPRDFLAGIEKTGRTVSTFLGAFPEALSDAAARLAEVERDSSDAAARLGSRLLALEGNVGGRSEASEDLPLTVWESLGALWSIKAEFNDFVAKLDGFADEESKRVGERDKAMVTYKKQVSKVMETLGSKVQELFAAQASLGQKLSEKRVAFESTATPGMDALIAGMAGTSSESGTDLEGLRKEMAALRKDMIAVKGGEARQGVTLAGLSFHTKEDLQAWCVENLPDAPFGAFVDFFSLLQQVDFDQNGAATTEEMLKSLKLRNDLDLSTNGDILALASLRSAVPVLFGRGSIPNGADRSRFAAYPKFSDWEDPSGLDGLMDKLSGWLVTAKEAVELDIELRTEAGTLGAMLATTCLSKSLIFVDGFCKYLSKTYTHLKHAKFSEKKAWSLTTALGERICQEVHKERGALLRSIKVKKDKASQDNLAVLMIWATLRSHEIMADYSRLEFKDHPTIASEYVKFLATNSGFEVVTQLETKLESANKEIASLKKDLASCKGTLDKVSSKVDETSKSLVKVIKKYPL